MKKSLKIWKIAENSHVDDIWKSSKIWKIQLLCE